MLTRPAIIEVAINGSRTKALNPHVPLATAEIVESISACVKAGASIVHSHASEAVVGAGGRHDSSAYKEPYAQARERHPDLLLYPTLPGGGPGTSMKLRLAHVLELARSGLVGLIPVDPGTMNYGRIDGQGRPPAHDQVYQTTFADTAVAFELCRQHDLPCTMSAFEPGFVRLVEAHRRAGSLPQASIVKLEFCAGDRLFGLTPDAHGLEAWLRLFDSDRVPWMVTLRDGDPADGLAKLAFERGGHVRVGIEDYGGPHTPRNEELVSAAVRIAEASGRRPALPSEVPQLLRSH